VIAATKTVPSRPPLLLCALCDLCVENSPILLRSTARMLSPFPATLTRNQRFCRKTPPVSPFLATLTDTPSRKSFPCHSYENMGGVPPLVPASKSRRPRNPLTPLESALTDSSSRKSFRIRSYEKHRGEGGLPPHGPQRPLSAPTHERYIGGDTCAESSLVLHHGRQFGASA